MNGEKCSFNHFSRFAWSQNIAFFVRNAHSNVDFPHIDFYISKICNTQGHNITNDDWEGTECVEYESNMYSLDHF